MTTDLRHYINILLENQMLAEFQQEIRLTGFYDQIRDDQSLAEAVSSRPMRQFSKNPGAQTLIRYLHGKEKLSSRARFEPHDMKTRLPWKQLKTHPDNIMMFIGPNGIAAAKPAYDPYTRKIGMARGPQDEPGDTNLIYDVYYNLNDADGISVEKYETKRGGLPDKRDDRNPNNIADFIRDRLGVRGRFNAIYIAGRYTMGGEEEMTDPEKEQELQSIENRTGRPEELQKSPISALFRGRRSTGVTKPGHSVERIKGVMRGSASDTKVKLADRLLPIIPNLIRQAKVKMIRLGLRDQAKEVGEREYHSPGESRSQLVRWIEFKVIPYFENQLRTDEFGPPIWDFLEFRTKNDYVRDQLKFVLKNTADIENSVQDINFVPAYIEQDAARKSKFETLRTNIETKAKDYAEKEIIDKVLKGAVAGQSGPLEKVIDIIRNQIFLDLKY